MRKEPWNKKYSEHDKCPFEGCDRPASLNGKCQTHNWQFRNYGMMWPIGGGRPVQKGFSTDRWCKKCKTWKNWRQYHLEQQMCAVCYRASLKPEVVVRKPVDKAEVLKQIESAIRANR